MVFKRGEVSNPQGGNIAKNKLTKQLKDLLASDVPAALQVIRDCLQEPENKTWAATQVLDRVFGKAPQMIDASDEASTVARAVLQILSRDDKDTIDG